MERIKDPLFTDDRTYVMGGNYSQGNLTAYHDFVVCASEDDTVLAEIHFQQGPVKEVGVNGLFNEDLLLMVLARLRAINQGEYSCRENSMAITKLEEAVMWLRKRTQDRVARGVEGDKPEVTGSGGGERAPLLKSEERRKKMMKVFISQPMAGLSQEEIMATRARITKKVEDSFGEKVTVLDSVIQDAPGEEYLNKPIAYLAKSLDIMAKADLIAFAKGYSSYRGCVIENQIAVTYGMAIMQEEPE